MAIIVRSAHTTILICAVIMVGVIGYLMVCAVHKERESRAELIKLGAEQKRLNELAIRALENTGKMKFLRDENGRIIGIDESFKPAE